MDRRGRARAVVAGAIVAVAIVSVVVAAIAVLESDSGGPDASAANAAKDGDASIAVQEAAIKRLDLPAPFFVREVDPSEPGDDGRIYEVQPFGPASPFGDLSCKRVAAAPDGSGALCLASARNGIEYDAVVLSLAGDEVLRRPIAGVPDRAQVSRDARYAGYTSFPREISSSYFQSTDDYSTFARILDMKTGKVVLELDDLRLFRNGRRLDTTGAEFWGVTFAKGGRFYATAAVGTDQYLISGVVGRKDARVIRTHVECPALSPDGKRIAYKRRFEGTNTWQFHVLDLETGKDIELAELRSIDDQPEWLSDDWIAYSDDRAVFAVPADGTGEPVRIVRNATSVSVGEGAMGAVR